MTGLLLTLFLFLVIVIWANRETFVSRIVEVAKPSFVATLKNVAIFDGAEHVKVVDTLLDFYNVIGVERWLNSKWWDHENISLQHDRGTWRCGAGKVEWIIGDSNIHQCNLVLNHHIKSWTPARIGKDHTDLEGFWLIQTAIQSYGDYVLDPRTGQGVGSLL